MKLSYWERNAWLTNVDYAIVGSGIVGLNCALAIRNQYPEANILILEKGILPQGASTKNAGFACFGSLSEILSDLETHSEEDLVRLVEGRYLGIKALRTLLGDDIIDYQGLGGHELFLEKDRVLFESCLKNLPRINEMLSPVFEDDAFSLTPNNFHFKNIQERYITHKFEGQINTGKMMKGLTQLALSSGISIMNSTAVSSFEDNGKTVLVKTNDFEFQCKKLCIATNGFATQLIDESLKPARAQVIITKPIKNLKIKGTFHLDQGYYYFRNIDNRILFGGGRNLDFKTEETTSFGETEIIQRKLEHLLKTVILPNTPFEVDYGWSGIMGVGPQKSPILKEISKNVACGIRLGGMGIAIGTAVGQKLALVLEKM